MKTRISIFRVIALALLTLGAATLLLATAGVITPNLNDSEEEETGKDHPDEALRFRRLQMQDEKGNIPADGLQKARQQMAVMKASQQARAAAAGKPEGLAVASLAPADWTWLGPGNVGGRVRSMVIDPNNANNMWLGSVGGGIWHSGDGGFSWGPVNDFMANLAVSTVVIDPVNTTNMYAGTGEGFGNGDALQGGGVFKSVDSGVTWNLLATTNPGAAAPPGCGLGSTPCPSFWLLVNRLAISPDANTILAATSAGLARSTDGGATWIQRPGPTTSVMDVDFRSGDSTQAVAGELGASLFSTDSGLTWGGAAYSPQITSSCTPPGNCALSTNGRVEMAYGQNNTFQVVYAVVNNNNGDVFRSSNGGQSFSRVNTGTNFFLPGGQNATSNGWYHNSIWVNPQNSNFIVVGGIDLWRSVDGGTNLTRISQWQSAPQSSAHADHHVIVSPPGFDNSSNKSVFFGNDGGVFHTDDISAVGPTSGWQSRNQFLGITQFYYGASGAAIIMGGAQDNGTNQFTVGGSSESWIELSSNGGNGSGDGGFCAFDTTNNIFYGETQNLGLFRIAGGGTTGTPIAGGITDSNQSSFIAPFLLDPNDPNTMVAGSVSVWRTNNVQSSPPTWTVIGQPIPPRPPPPGSTPGPNPQITSIAISPAASNFIVAGYQDGQIFLTLTGTSTTPSWSPINVAPLPSRTVTRVVIDDLRIPNWIYVTFGGFSNDNVYVTRDFGSTWTDVSGATGSPGDLPSVPIRSLTINPVTRNFLYVGTEVGIFASEDGGVTWQLPQGGPANVSVDDLVWHNGDLLAFTHGRGVYTTHTPLVDLPVCINPGNCQCYGFWDCPCTWPNNHLPGPNDDVDVTCSMTIRTGVSCRNMVVNGRLILQNNNANTTGTLVNNGLITTDVGMTGGVNVRDLINVRPQHVISNNGVITVTAITALGDVSDGGIIGLTSGLSCTNLTVAASDGALGSNASLATNGSITVRGNVFNNGTINDAGSLSLDDSNLAPTTHTITGTGIWNIGNALFVAPGDTALLAQDTNLGSASVTISQGATFKTQDHNLTVNGPAFDNNKGTLDIGTGNILFTGTDHFNGSGSDGTGSVLGSGTITLQPSDGSASFGDNNQFQPSLHLASGTIDGAGIFVGGKLTIDAGAALSLTGGTNIVNGDIRLDGSITKTGGGSITLFFNGQNFTNNGSFLTDFFTLNNSGSARTQTIGGNGAWLAGTTMNIGGGTGSTSNTTAQNDITLNQTNFNVGLGSVLNLQNFTLTYAGHQMSNGGNVTGTGKFKMMPSGGTANLVGNSFGSYSSEVRIASGTITVPSGGVSVSGPLNIDFGSTLAITSGSVIATGPTATNNGTLSGGGFNYAGNGLFTNAGSVVGTFLNMAPANFAAPPVVQQLGGSGTWTTDSGRLLVDARSTVTLATDVAYTGPTFFLDGRLNTDVYTFTLPCTTVWQGNGDIVGNIRRTNLSACAGAVAYGNPFTTIVFTGGTPPTEVTVKVTLGPPAGFPGAVQRTYLITPTGGSGYTATLRLHYLDSELNGNNESTMQLYRNNGTSWNAQGATARDTANNWVEFAGVTQFSPWTISSLTPPPPTPSPTPTPTPTATPLSTATPTATPTPVPTVQISGSAFYCSSSVSDPALNVTLTASGGPPASTTTDNSGNYLLSLISGGTYTVTPTKPDRLPASAGINTADVVAVQRHFLNYALLTGCRLTAADCAAPAGVNTTDVVAIQRFFLGQTSGLANVGKHVFTPVNRTYSSLSSNQTAQNYDVIVLGDVAPSFANPRPADPAPSADAALSTDTEVLLPDVQSNQPAARSFVVPVTATAINGANKFVGFQGDIVFDERAITFESDPVHKVGLTGGNWSVAGNVLDGPGPIRTLRVSAYSLDFAPLSGEGTLFELKIATVTKGLEDARLEWAPAPDGFVFIDSDVNVRPAVTR